MEQGHPRSHARGKEAVDNFVVEIQSLWIETTRVGEYSSPSDGKSICGDTEIAKDLYVFRVSMVVIAGDVAIGAIDDRAASMGEVVPAGRSRSIGQGRAFDLIGGARRSPYEAFWKCQVLHVPHFTAPG